MQCIDKAKTYLASTACCLKERTIFMPFLMYSNVVPYWLLKKSLASKEVITTNISLNLGHLFKEISYFPYFSDKLKLFIYLLFIYKEFFLVVTLQDNPYFMSFWEAVFLEIFSWSDNCEYISSTSSWMHFI